MLAERVYGEADECTDKRGGFVKVVGIFLLKFVAVS